MNDLELEDWRNIRESGRGRLGAQTVVKRGLMLAWPLVGLLVLALWLQGSDELFWTSNQLLLGAFVGVTLVVGIGEGLYGWTARAGKFEEPDRWYRARFARASQASGETPRHRRAPVNQRPKNKRVFLDTALIYEARALQSRHDQGIADLDQQYRKFGPIFRSTLAVEAGQLAKDAGVSDKAAFLALMRQFDN